MHLKLPPKIIPKTSVTTGGLIGNKNADKVKKVSKTLPQNSLGTVTNKQKAMNNMIIEHQKVIKQ